LGDSVTQENPTMNSKTLGNQNNYLHKKVQEKDEIENLIAQLARQKDQGDSKTTMSRPVSRDAWCKHGWIDIPKFYKNFYSISKGQQFRELQTAIRYVDDDWLKTYTMNTGKDYKWLVNVYVWFKVKSSITMPTKTTRGFKFNNLVEKRKNSSKFGGELDYEKDGTLRAQMLEEITSIPKNMNTFFKKGVDTLNTMTSTSNRIDSICDVVEELMQKVNNSVNFAVGAFKSYMPVIHFVIKVVALGYMLTIPENRTPMVIAALLTIILPSGDGSAFLTRCLSRVVQGIYQFVAHEEPDTTGIIQTFFQMIKNLLQTLFADIPAEVFKVMSIDVKKLKVISDTIRSVTTIVDFFVKLLDKLFTLIGDKILQYYGILPWFMREDRITPLIDEFTHIKLENLDKKCQTNKHAAKRVIECYHNVLKFESSYIRQVGKGTSLENAKILPFVRVMSRHLEEAVKHIPEHLKNGKNPRRIKPFWAYIYGDPRVGKTSFFQPLLINALVKTLQIREEYQDYAEYTYFRNCGDEYWEKYAGQPVLWYNDLFQNFRDEQAMNNAVMELTNVVDDNLYCLNMAFEEKGAVFFDSELVISNAQCDMIGLGAIENLCLSGGTHLRARRNVVLEFCLNFQYKTKEGLIDLAKVASAINGGVECIAGSVPIDMYSVIFHDPMGGHVMKELPFLSAVKEVCLMAKNYKDKQTTFKDRLYQYYEDSWKNDLFAMAGDGDEKSVPPPTTVNLKRRVPKKCECEPSRFKNCRCDVFIVQAATMFREDRIGFDLNDNERFQKARGQFLEHHTEHIDYDGAYAFCNNILQEIQGEVRRFRPNEFDNDLHSGDTFYDAVEEIHDYYKVCDQIDSLLQRMTGERSRYRINRSYHENNANGFIEHFIAVNRDCDDDVIGRVSICVELTNGQAFDRQTQQMLHANLWTKFKHYAYQAKKDFFSHLEQCVNKYPNLVFFSVATLVFTVLQTTSTIMKYKSDKEIFTNMTETQTKIYEQYSKLNPQEFDDWIMAQYKFVPNINYEEYLRYQKEKQNIELNIETPKVVASVAASQTAEGKTQRKIPQARRVKQTKPNTQSYEQQNRDIEQHVATHICKVGAEVKHDGADIDMKFFGTALNVGGDVFIIPKHFYTRWKTFYELYSEKGDQFRVYFQWTPVMRQYVDFEEVKVWDSDYNHHKDLVFVQVRNMVQMKHMAKFFVKVTDDPILYESYLYGLRVGDFNPSLMQVSGCHRRDTIYTHGGRTDPVYGMNIPDRDIVLPDCYHYESSYTLAGDCGLVLFNTDSKLNCRKIMGIHTAGSIVNGVGITSPVYQEDVLEAIDYFARESEPLDVQSSEYIGGDITSKIEQQLRDTGISVVGGSGVFVHPVTGKAKKIKMTIPSETKISKSVMHDIMEEDFGPAKTAPAILKPVAQGESKIYPIVKAASKMAKIGPVIKRSEIDPVVKHMECTFRNRRNKYGPPRILTNHEAINGFGSLKQLDMSTSAGFPYTLIDATKGKVPFFELDEKTHTYSMKAYVAQQFNEREQLAKQGVIKEVVFVDTLKDETRPLEKVAAIKTRLFQVAPVDYNMMLRKYFGWFIAVCQDNSIDGEIAVGINANSYEWTLLVNRLLSMGKTVGAGDTSNHDASCIQQILMEIVQAINAWYNDGAENARVRRVLFATFLNSLHIIEDLVYRMLQGNKSGITLTTIVNCLMEMFIVRLTFLRKFGTLVDFSKNISSTIYGDDIVNAISDRIANILTAKDFADVYQSLGFDYTTVDKSGANETYYTIDQITYLKRKFIYDENLNLYKAQLDHDVIYEICRWSESDPTNMEDQLNRINSCLLELSNYNKVEFEMFRNKMIEYCTILRGRGLVIDITRIFDWMYCHKIKYPHIFK